MKMKKWTNLLLVVLLVVACGTVFAGNDYPIKPIKLIVPYNAGGGADIVARIVQKGLQKVLSQPVAIVNIGGGASVVGMLEVKNAKPDGYTMGMNNITMWTNYILGTADYGPLDFEPVAQAGTYYSTIVAGSKSKYKNLKDLAGNLKKQPHQVAHAINIGSIAHFTSLALQDAIGGKAAFRFVHIGDGASRIAAIIGGQVDTTLMGTHEVQPYYKSGQMRILAIFSPKRLKSYPDVPTAREQGINLIRPISYWYFMPKGTPKERVDYMADVLEKVMKDPETINNFNNLVIEPGFLRGKRLIQQLKADGKEIQTIAQKYDIKMN
jgi:tripartite-type tricarboxylate transporter receptor subunit TctC